MSKQLDIYFVDDSGCTSPVTVSVSETLAGRRFLCPCILSVGVIFPVFDVGFSVSTEYCKNIPGRVIYYWDKQVPPLLEFPEK